MSNNATVLSKRVGGLVPAHYKSDYPVFIEFMQGYFEWLHRAPGITQDERDVLLADTEWVSINTQEFIENGAAKYLTDGDADIDQAVREFGRIINPGSGVKRLRDDVVMIRAFGGLETSDGEVLVDSNNETIEVPDRDTHHFDEWLRTLSFPLPSDPIVSRRVDRGMFIRLIKHISACRGTQSATHLFFWMFFGEDIAQNNPYSNDPIWVTRTNIMTIDNINHKIDHADNTMRDDWFYNEFSYVIFVKNQVDHYKDLFEQVYIPYLHAAGFAVFLRQV